MTLALFALFGPVSIVLAVIVCGIILAAIENDSVEFAAIATVIFALVLGFVGEPSLFSYLRLHADQAWWYLLYYFIGGVGFQFAKWTAFNAKFWSKYEDIKLAWLRSKKINDRFIPANLREAFQDYLKHSDYSNAQYAGTLEDIRPRPWNYKQRIATWGVWWPLNLFWMLADDVLKNIWKYMQRITSNMMDGISEFMSRGVKKDFE